MQLEQNFMLPLPPARAWPAFKDIGLLVECLPGASLTGPEADGKLPLRFDVKLGPISAGFTGSGSATFNDADMAGSFEGQAADKRTGSRVRGTAAFALQPHGNGTRVLITVDYTLTGALAQFSRGALVRELASALTAQFAQQLAVRLQAAPDAGALGAHGAAAAPPAVVPLNAWTLLKQLMARRWARWTGRDTELLPGAEK
jgi:carbon monoxide dehydrogenase subunit G